MPRAILAKHLKSMDIRLARAKNADKADDLRKPNLRNAGDAFRLRKRNAWLLRWCQACRIRKRFVKELVTSRVHGAACSCGSAVALH